MLPKEFSDLLKYHAVRRGAHQDGAETPQKIEFRRFEQSKKTMQTLRSSGLDSKIDNYIDVESNYEIQKIIGYGATSVVYKAQMQNNGKTTPVAIKKVRNIFESDIYAHRILREIRLMRLLKGHKNVSFRYRPI